MSKVSPPDNFFACRLCDQPCRHPGLDLGPQPIANRFKPSADVPDYRHPLKLLQCEGCGLVQLAESFPSDELRPRLDWIRYREREDHLDEAIASFLPFLTEHVENPRVFGLTDFDRVLFQALQKQRPKSTYVQLSPQDLTISTSHYGMETIQAALTPQRARHFADQQGVAQIMVSRYLFEHAENPLSLLASYSELLSPDGFLLLEVPDSKAPLDQCDYPMIWEEHVSYFTEATLVSVLESNGFAVRSVFKAASKFESPLMVLAQKRAQEKSPIKAAPSALTCFEQFRDSFPQRRLQFRSFCQQHQEAGFTVVLFGAGHFTVAFANFFSLEPYLDCVIDDDPNKVGQFLSGTSLPILSSARLKQDGPVLVLLCVNPDVETRVMEKISCFSRDGDRQYSIFAASPRFCLHV